MNQLQNKSFEKALVRYREKWDKIKDPCVVYDFPITDVSCKELFLKRVSEHPDKTYVISRGTKMSYVECNTLAAKIANGFLAKGLKKGDRVITYLLPMATEKIFLNLIPFASAYRHSSQGSRCPSLQLYLCSLW